MAPSSWLDVIVKGSREVQKALHQKGGHAVPVECDLSEIASVRHAAAEIAALGLPIAGLLNNAGIRQQARRRTRWAGT